MLFGAQRRGFATHHCYLRSDQSHPDRLHFRGSPSVCRKQVAVAVLAWMALGVPLAFSKGQFGTGIYWIGASFTVQDNCVVATIQAARLQELRDLVSVMFS